MSVTLPGTRGSVAWTLRGSQAAVRALTHRAGRVPRAVSTRERAVQLGPPAPPQGWSEPCCTG